MFLWLIKNFMLVTICPDSLVVYGGLEAISTVTLRWRGRHVYLFCLYGDFASLLVRPRPQTTYRIRAGKWRKQKMRVTQSGSSSRPVCTSGPSVITTISTSLYISCKSLFGEILLSYRVRLKNISKEYNSTLYHSEAGKVDNTGL